MPGSCDAGSEDLTSAAGIHASLPLLHVAGKRHFVDHEAVTDRITPGDTAWNFRVLRIRHQCRHWCSAAQRTLEAVSCKALLAARGYEPGEQIAILCVSPLMLVRSPDTKSILNVAIILFS